MVPRTFPSTVNSTTGRRQMVVFFLSSATGLQRWKDYIPVKFVLDDTPTEASYNNDGYIAIDELSSTSGKQEWKDYVPVFLDNSATDAWEVDSNGFIQVGTSGFGGVPNSLFASGEQGAWYDPSDSTTLFQDAAGTTPVTAVEQPVSLMLDKSKNAIGTNGAKRVNLLSYSEQFNDAAWLKNGITITSITTTAPDGTSTADLMTEDVTGFGHNIALANAVTVGLVYVLSFYAKTNGNTYAWGGPHNGSAGYQGVWFDLVNGTVGTQKNGAVGSIISVGNGWYRCTNVFTATAGYLAQQNIGTSDANGTVNYTGDGTSGIYLWGADLRLTSEVNTLPTYQRITDTWYNTFAGNHAFTPAASTASRPVLSSRYNLLTKTEQFDDAIWSKAGASLTTVTANTTIAPNGTTTADTITFSGTDGAHRIFQDATTQAINGVAVVGSIWLRTDTPCTIRLSIERTGPADVEDVVCSVTATWQQFTLLHSTTWTGTTVLRLRLHSISSVGSVYAWGASLTVANDGVGIPYQRVNTSTDYDSGTAFPRYLRFDGSDDFMQTNSVNFTGTDKMTVFAGVRKLSDAASAMLMEISTSLSSNNGAFYFTAPESGGATKFAFSSKGTSSATASTTSSIYNAPVTKTLTGLGDISEDLAILRIDGAQVASSTADQGTGNYGNYPLYIGRRGGTTLPFNGRIFSLIIRGAESTTPQIQSTENYVNSKTKAY